MRLMSQRQATYLSKLRKLANGDVDLVERAIESAYQKAKQQRIPDPAPRLGDVIEFIRNETASTKDADRKPDSVF
jgi:hypothetical protein